MINLDRQLYLVITAHKSGAYVPEQNLCEMDRAKVIKDVKDGQYDTVMAVIEFNPIEHTSRDATQDILCNVVAEWENECEGEEFSEWKIECIEQWFGVRAANKYRQREDA